MKEEELEVFRNIKYCYEGDDEKLYPMVYSDYKIGIPGKNLPKGSPQIIQIERGPRKRRLNYQPKGLMWGEYLKWLKKDIEITKI